MSWLVFYAVQARRVIDANPEHPGLKEATAELQRAFRAGGNGASTGTTDPLSQHFARLAVHGVTPAHVLSMYAAVALYERNNPRALRDAGQFRYAVARAICGLAPRGGQVLRARALDRIGGYVTERFSGLAAGIVTAVEKSEAGARQRAAVMSEPFNLP